MKKIKVFITLLSLFLGFGAMAQFTYGPKLGLNLANQSGDVEDNKMLIGFNIGAVGNYSIAEMFSVQAEILYDKKGAKYEWEDLDGNTQSAPISLGYINIPIMGVASFGDDIKFFGELGPTIGILTSAKYDGESEFEMMVYDPQNPFAPPTTEKVKYKDWYKSTDMGLVIGAGVGIPVSNMVCKVDLRYNFSLGTIHEPEEGSNEEAQKINNSVISVNATLMLGGK